MDVTIVKTENGKDYNCYDEEVIACGLCGAGTTMTGTKRCDRCWELEGRIADVAPVNKILFHIKWRGG